MQCVKMFLVQAKLPLVTKHANATKMVITIRLLEPSQDKTTEVEISIQCAGFEQAEQTLLVPRTHTLVRILDTAIHMAVAIALLDTSVESVCHLAA